MISPGARNAQAPRKRINLALQGGGAHGAFTWGVLDRLLEDERIEIAAMSGTSAGAVNSVALADGFVRNGSSGAREKLGDLWGAISEAGRFSAMQRTPIEKWFGSWGLDRAFGLQAFQAMTQAFSPYQFNPFDLDPLRDALAKAIDFQCVRDCAGIRLFISATNVETGRVKVFDSRELTIDMVMASACLPYLQKAVIIEGVPYWDGGYMGNPALFPFHTESDCGDIVVVQINPIERRGVPKTAQDIQDRLNEISFNSSLLKELRSIDFVSRLIAEGRLDERRYRLERVHIIENQRALSPLGASSKLNVEWPFLVRLRDLGRETAGRWLDAHFDDLGSRATVDLRSMFTGIGPQHQG